MLAWTAKRPGHILGIEECLWISQILHIRLLWVIVCVCIYVRLNTDPILLAGEHIFCPDERVDRAGDELFSRGVSLHLGWLLLHGAAPVLRWVHSAAFPFSISPFYFHISFHFCCFSKSVITDRLSDIWWFNWQLKIYPLISFCRSF